MYESLTQIRAIIDIQTGRYNINSLGVGLSNMSMLAGKQEPLKTIANHVDYSKGFINDRYVSELESISKTLRLVDLEEKKMLAKIDQSFIKYTEVKDLMTEFERQHEELQSTICQLDCERAKNTNSSAIQSLNDDFLSKVHILEVTVGGIGETIPSAFIDLKNTIKVYMEYFQNSVNEINKNIQFTNETEHDALEMWVKFSWN